jgi:CBS domain-containing protein
MASNKRVEQKEKIERSNYEEYSYSDNVNETGYGGSRHIRCRDIMTREIVVATRNTTLDQVAAMMRDDDTGIIPIVDKASHAGDVLNEQSRHDDLNNGKLVGLITDRDIVIRAVSQGLDTRTVAAEEIMSKELHTAQPGDRVIDVIRKMGEKKVRRIPVVDQENNLRGIISIADIALETEEDRELADAIEEISSGSSFWNKIFV